MSFENKENARITIQGLETGLDKLRKGCEPDHSVMEFSWGLIAGKCKVRDLGKEGIVIELKPWAWSFDIETGDEIIKRRKVYGYEEVVKRAIVQAVEHLLRVYEGRRSEFTDDLARPNIKDG